MSTFQIDFSSLNKKRIVGIDLGTTNSLVAFMDLTGPAVIPGFSGSPITPSIVSLNDDGTYTVAPPPGSCSSTAGPHYLFREAPDGPWRIRCAG